ncbi:hypothetical protein NQ176_g575 [Zarea fungicola]|uniref:Uncharacterized protein n=1 Tax=Zarea fungicola TaxID=93591 RepID=A0ACC1NW98_9HYPO|nr:hypothetical protein NQ176_g575 [Lecanicillium fungicola]
MPRATARVGQVVVAETEQWEFVEDNVYFPPETIRQELLQPSNHSTYCSWKGQATYNNVVADGKTLENVVWHYHTCFDKAKYIENYYAFYKDKGVEVVIED